MRQGKIWRCFDARWILFAQVLRGEGTEGNPLLLELTVNDRKRSVDVDPSLRLVDLLRDVLGLTSVKEGCSEGECGACTVLLDGEAVTSCTTLAVQARGRSVLTLEGLAARGELHPLQRAFEEHDAVQCGFCTPGMILSAYGLLKKNPRPDEEAIRRALEGNLCRCTGYVPILRAVRAAAEALS
ncbi:(2Fe-2S)-binding domain protein [Aminomonas paucivorans DSM 12260]|uniref:(2Fe-2S)-binding domain protein n=1 Tax=Aminomonas paucivorans DSM 12260 TaxID=584708 RepID=E3CYY3_9BACT|nr:(2Fe-2S)-binding domain protein [Aminomonas paucivorans DSM 12260]